MKHPYSEIPEVFQGGQQFGVIRIPSEQDIPVTERVLRLIDTAEFQRLRLVTQLALASRVYPGATHTRFEHALGVYHNSLQYLWQLGRDPRFADTVSVHDAEVLIVAALLHDIGHWPFCHPIEDMNLIGMPPHEAFAREFLADGCELAEVLRSSWNIEPAEVLDVLLPQSQDASFRLRRSILSGPVDIDKMDYLVRDSQHCGVPYGKHFDRHRLINSLIVNEAGDGLAITSKGRTAAEMMVFARYVMFTEVYWHHAVRSATTMFARSFYELYSSLDLKQLFRMPEPELIRTLVTAAQGSSVQKLTDGLFGHRRLLHKRLAEFTAFHKSELYRSLRQCSYSDVVSISDQLSAALGERLGRRIDQFDVLIDAPPQHREVEFRVDVFSPSDNEYRPLREVSPIVDSMARTQFDDCVKKVRIFGSAEVAQPLHQTPDLLESTIETLLSKRP
ncbi:MAG: HD domain-containing protein [Planctomyces sp.]|nr:HD domain-containing protein [Planctomyces sp.]